MIISQPGLTPEALRGETVIVTGAGDGIGLEGSLRCVYRWREEVEALAAAIQ